MFVLICYSTVCCGVVYACILCLRCFVVNRLYENKGDGTFAAATNAGPVTSDTDNSKGVAWGDYDNDGDLDLIVVNDRGKASTVERGEEEWVVLLRWSARGTYVAVCGVL